MEANYITHVNITINTDAVIRDYPNPSKDSGKPTGIGHSYEYMVASNNTAISGQGGADLNFAAAVGDTVRFYGTSESNNFDNSVLIYGIVKFGGENVFSDFVSQSFVKKDTYPSGKSVLPATFRDNEFYFFEADVINRGTENYKVQFALYVRDRSKEDPVLYGYFQWDPTITVKS